MPILRYFKKMQQLDGLIRRKATGTQEQFASKVNMGRGMLNIYLNEMKELGFPIAYCRSRNTYYYEEEGRIVNNLFEKHQITEKEATSYKGGLSLVALEEETLINNILQQPIAC